MKEKDKQNQMDKYYLKANQQSKKNEINKKTIICFKFT